MRTMDKQKNDAPSLVRSDALLAACDLLADYTGSCPLVLHDWKHPETCEKHCSDDAPPGCWVEYVKSTVANAENEGLTAPERNE